MATRTNLSTNLDYVAYSSSDTMATIFLQVDACLKAHGWTQASGTSGSFFTTYDPAAGTPSTTDLRRVYSAPLANSNSGLSTKYVMVRMLTGYAYLASAVTIQMIPFVSWNSGTDVGTNPAGCALTDAANVNGNWDSSNWNNNDDAEYGGKAPHTWFKLGVSGFLYVAASAKWICMWPYFVSTTIYDGQRNQHLFYGEISDDFASYTNVPPVFVSTLQRLLYATGTVNEPSAYTSGGYSMNSYGTWQPQFLMPVTPASTTGYTGVSNTTRNGYQAMGGTRIQFGHYGWFGYEGYGWYNNNASYPYSSYYQPYQMATYFQSPPTSFVMNLSYYSSPQPVLTKYAMKKWEDPGAGTYNAGTQNTFAQSWAPTALNSTNLKGIEPVFGGGVMSSNYTGYNSNPYPMFWVLGRAYGLKWVGTPASGTWATLDTVNMTTDSNYFYTKTGGTTNSFILLGVGPSSADNAGAAPKTGATLFFALPA